MVAALCSCAALVDCSGPSGVAGGTGADAAAPDQGAGTPACDAGEPADAYAAAQPFECNESLQTVPTRPGVTLSFDLVVPVQAIPTAAVILLPGGGGLLDLSATGIAQGADNFCVRTRQSFALAGLVAAVPDAPSDRRQGLDNFRGSLEHAEDLRALVQWLRAKYAGISVLVVGTSRGTISTADVAARFAAPAGPDHIVLTSSVTTIPAGATDQEDIQSVPDYLSQLAGRAPFLMIDNALDRCGASPPPGAQALATSIGDSKDFVLVDGGSQPSGADPCGGISYHGFYGLEAQVVGQIVQRINTGK